MWVIFVISATIFAIIALLLVYIANKVVNQIRKDNHDFDMIINKHLKEKKEKE